MKGEPITPPVVFSATYAFERSDDLIDVVRNRSGYIYSRWDNPTVREVEKELASMERYTDAVAFSSGMATITSVLLSLLDPEDKLVSIATYGEAIRFISDFLPKMGVEVKQFGPDDIDQCIKSMKNGVRMLYLENPMNPLLRVVDIKPLTDEAHRSGALVVLDSTFASPTNQHPIDLDVDIVIHSATKYLGGHHDLIGGLACMNFENQDLVWKMKNFMNSLAAITLATSLGGVDPLATQPVTNTHASMNEEPQAYRTTSSAFRLGLRIRN